jgi:hypothetical protein
MIDLLPLSMLVLGVALLIIPSIGLLVDWLNNF